MLSRSLKRALLEKPLPPTFLLPWAAGLTTVSHATEAGNVPPPLSNSAQHVSADRTTSVPSNTAPDALSGILAPKLPSPSNAGSATAPINISDTVRELLPVLQAQGPHYMTVHLHDRPYLVTQGDTVRLPFLMKNVEPGDVLRLNRASIIGSRDYTLKAAAPPPKLKSATNSSVMILDPTSGNLASHSQVMPTPGSDAAAAMPAGTAVAPHFVPHIAKGKVSYLDERLFVCRAVVMGVESEPMQYVEKTKRRQRKVKTVKSKHKFTVVRIKELRVRNLEEIESENSES